MSYKLSRNESCWCGSGVKYKKCHAALDAKMAQYETEGCLVPGHELLKTKQQIQGIRESSKINIALLDLIGGYVADGVDTAELDRIIHDKTLELGGIPAPLGYNGFPASVCISVNDVVCHGIPSKNTVLQEGDIVNIDVSTIYKGYYSDSSRMFEVGEVKSQKRHLINTARECMERGIQKVRPWGFLGDIGQAVNDYAIENGYTVVREIGGHGVGRQFHEEPWVSYVTKEKTGMLLVPGMVFTIEPMINMGTAEIITDEKDGWTVYTADGNPSAQWEKTVLVTEEGCEILTY